MSTLKKSLVHIKSFVRKHKWRSTIIGLAIIIILYYLFGSSSAASTSQYLVKKVSTGSISRTVTGTGQITSASQRDVLAQVSGTITGIKVSIGQQVKTGDLLATIDATDAWNSLESARIAYAKLVKAPTQTELSSANNTVSQAYTSAFNAINDTFIQSQIILPGMNDMLYGKDGFLGDQNATYLSVSARNYRDSAGLAYDIAKRKYDALLDKYKTLSRSSATSTIYGVLQDTYDMAKSISNAMQSAQNAITFIITNQSEYMTSVSTTAKSNVSSWLGTINSNVSSLLGTKNTIESSENSLNDLIVGADTLDIQSQLLSLRQAEQNYAKYFIRAPFDGVVGRIPVNVGDQAGASTIMATVIGNNKTTSISLNEVDAVQVKSGNTVSLTFDAIEGLTATGTVSSVDLVGTVSSGIVSYTVKITISTDDRRILPGMSVHAVIYTETKDNIIVVPSSALKTSGKKTYVLMVGDVSSNKNQTTLPITTITKQQTVTTGISDDLNTEILTGLSGGEWIVVQTITTSSNQSSSSLFSMLGNRRTTTTSSSSRTSSTRSTSNSNTRTNSTMPAGGPPPF